MCEGCTTGPPTRMRGRLIPEGFHNPFLRRSRHASTPAVASIGEPDITVGMAVEFFEACDVYQLRLFGPIAIFGLRASEPCLLFHEHLSRDWLDVPCLPELAYYTKGRRDKASPDRVRTRLDCFGRHWEMRPFRVALSASRRDRQRRHRTARRGIAQDARNRVFSGAALPPGFARSPTGTGSATDSCTMRAESTTTIS